MTTLKTSLHSTHFASTPSLIASVAVQYVQNRLSIKYCAQTAVPPTTVHTVQISMTTTCPNKCKYLLKFLPHQKRYAFTSHWYGYPLQWQQIITTQSSRGAQPLNYHYAFALPRIFAICNGIATHAPTIQSLFGNPSARSVALLMALHCLCIQIIILYPGGLGIIMPEHITPSILIYSVRYQRYCCCQKTFRERDMVV